MPLLILITAALAQSPGVTLLDAGKAMPEARPALVLVTPGVPVSAYEVWVNAVEREGLDAWTLSFEPGEQGPDEVVAEVSGAFATLAQGRPTPVVLAHGYGGVFALLAEIEPSRLILVGTPLAAQPVAVQVRPEPGARASALPWDPELLGELPAAPYSGALSRAYAGWATEFPAYKAPSCPTLLVASTRDPVAPPEVVRLPSQGWPARTWVRPGPLRYDTHDLSHAELLSDPDLARQVARFAAEESP